MTPVERQEWAREFDILFVIINNIFLFETGMLKVPTFAICLKIFEIVQQVSGTDPPTLGIDPPAFGDDPPTLGTDPFTFGIGPPTFWTDPLTFGTDPQTFGVIH